MLPKIKSNEANIPSCLLHSDPMWMLQGAIAKIYVFIESQASRH